MDRDFLNEIWLQFETEAMEHCTSSEDLLLDTEFSGSEAIKIDSLFRAFHSLKGLFGTVGLNQTLELTHLIEDVIDKIRSREMLLNNQIRGILLQCIDVIKNIITLSSQERNEIVDEDLDVVKQLIVSIETTDFHADQNFKNIERKNLDDPILVSNKSDRFATVDLESLDFLFNKAGLVSSQVNILKNMTKLGMDNPQSIENVDKLINTLQTEVTTLNQAVTDLRLVSVNSLIRRLKRDVFETGTSLNKNIEFSVTGDNERADRTIINVLSSALMHLLRNSVDHGIEKNEERGKKGNGKICLDFRKEEDGLLITVSDDGEGLNRKKIEKKLRQLELLGDDDINKLSDPRLYDYIFQPGFSTKSDVSATSGRGVGLDVVKKNISSLGGTINVFSDAGIGTKFFLRIPNIVSTEVCLVLTDLKTIYAFPTRSILWVRSVAQVDFQKHSTIRSIVHEKNIIPVHNAHDLFGNLAENKDELDEKIILINMNEKAFALSYKGKLTYSEHVFDEPDPLVSKLPFVSGTTVDQDRNIIFRANLEKLFEINERAA